jgi:hypothetical protein
MRFRKPSHATVVAYLALFAALGGTALAAHDRFGAADIKHPIVRKAKFTPSAQGGVGAVVARCHKNEQLIGGAGGWAREGGSNEEAPTIAQALIGTSGGGRAQNFTVRGRAPALNNHLVAQAVCLPK